MITPGIAAAPRPACKSMKDCWKYDINMVCGDQKVCECRQDMKWNKKHLECQVRIILFDHPFK